MRICTIFPVSNVSQTFTNGVVLLISNWGNFFISYRNVTTLILFFIKTDVIKKVVFLESQFRHLNYKLSACIIKPDICLQLCNNLTKLMNNNYLLNNFE